MRPVTSPRRRVLAMNSSVPPLIVSSACSQPSRPPTNRCMMPSVTSIWRPVYEYQPTSCAMFSKPCSVRKRSSSSSGLIPASSRLNTLRISSSSNTIDVFDCSAPTGRASRHSPANPETEANSITPSLARHLDAAAHHRDELAHAARIGERVERLVREQLVGLVGARVESNLDEQELEPRAFLTQHAAVDDLRVRHVPRLRGVPALARDELDQLLFGRHSASSLLSWNQKNPRGAIVSR